ncbi:MAG TPA: triose-phosphate isomerase [Woeseiaceae bacterium]|nr:triose-phosphate isomerase [Woeseiaceae bacterium]
MRDYLVAGNWKMNGGTAANAALLQGILNGLPEVSAAGAVELLVCPPFPFLEATAEKLAGTGIALGAQNLSEHASGAYTGEVAASMLRDVGCEYAIVGHSERRALFGETSATVAAKFEAALAARLVPLLCVGETLEERAAGRTEAVVGEQLGAVLERLGIEAFAGGAVIAYEPVWAIGTGHTATPGQAQDVHRHIRRLLAEEDAAVGEEVQLLYGGSVKGDNAAGLMAMPDIDGGLIGGASLKADEFLAIAAAAAMARS